MLRVGSWDVGGPLEGNREMDERWEQVSMCSFGDRCMTTLLETLTKRKF